MKRITRNGCAGAAVAVLLATVGLSPSAKAQLVLTYEDSVSGHAIGSAFTGGGFRINLQNFDNGALYPDLGAVGNSAGYGAGGGAANVGAGATALNSLQTAGATGAQPNEDTWGIARIISITDAAGSVIWSEPGKNAELTIMFYGEQDYYVSQLADGFQEINGTGLHVDLWLQSKSDPAYTQYNPLNGSAGRTGLSSYTSVTDGTMILSTVSTAGFLHPDGTLGGSSAEFLTNFNQTSGGTGQTYLSVTGGSEASRFNTNTYNAPYLAGTTADMFAQFTTVINQNPSVSDWLVRSNDPVTGQLAQRVPDAASSVTYSLLGATALLGAAAMRRRGARLLHSA